MTICKWGVTVSKNRNSGFTLIELSIVLVIIGLVIGGVLVGRDLIDTAANRAAIAQIEQYRAATQAFRVKYGGLPGDYQATKAAQAGFTSRSGAAGHGDGNMLIEGCAAMLPWPVARMYFSGRIYRLLS
jgi:prepilin-type N-terminal cleavage/methylation domain-containing protein